MAPIPATDQANAGLAIITGASSGIGSQMATLLAQRGYRTVLIARRAAKIEELAGQLSQWSPSRALTLDLADERAITPAMDELLRELGPAQVLINNAGCTLYKPFLENRDDEHRRLMQVNYFAAVAMIEAVLPGMVKQHRGHIINIASMASKIGPWGHASYAAAKAALVSLTQTLAAEHMDDGLHFSYVNPGFVQTEFFGDPKLAPVVDRHGRRSMSAQYVATQIVGLLDHPRLELCLPRHYRLLDWIKALSPTLAHRIVANNSRPKTKSVSDSEQPTLGTTAEQTPPGKFQG